MRRSSGTLRCLKTLPPLDEEWTAIAAILDGPLFQFSESDPGKPHETFSLVPSGRMTQSHCLIIPRLGVKLVGRLKGYDLMDAFHLGTNVQ